MTTTARSRLVIVAAIATALLAGCGGMSHQTRSGSSLVTPASAELRSDRPAWHQVSLDGVHVNVPASWPTIAATGMYACEQPGFPAPDKVYIGSPSALALSISCAAIQVRHRHGVDAVWLQPGDRVPGVTRAEMTRAGVKVEVADSRLVRSEPVIDAYYRGVTIEIGVGADRATARAVFQSIGYTPGAKNTFVPGACPTWVHRSMPAPVRLTHAMLLDAAEAILEPAPAGARPRMTAAEAWKQSDANLGVAGDTYHVLLALYRPGNERQPHRVAKADPMPGQAAVLAWVVYQVPTTTSAGACDLYGLSVYNAMTGASLLDSGYVPGP